MHVVTLSLPRVDPSSYTQGSPTVFLLSAHPITNNDGPLDTLSLDFEQSVAGERSEDWRCGVSAVK